MKRSRTGCRACRARKIKCDEGRPACTTCMKRHVHCIYEVKYQWIAHGDFQNTGKRAASSQKTKESDSQDGSPLSDGESPENSGNEANGNAKKDGTKEKQKPTYKPRRGPVSRNRIIGQEPMGHNPFTSIELAKISTVMEEIGFVAEDDVITETDCPGALNQFKRFRIRDRNETRLSPYNRNSIDAITSKESPNGAAIQFSSIVSNAPNAAPPGVKIHMHSPLLRPFKAGDGVIRTITHPFNGDLSAARLASPGSLFPEHSMSSLYGDQTTATQIRPPIPQHDVTSPHGSLGAASGGAISHGSMTGGSMNGSVVSIGSFGGSSVDLPSMGNPAFFLLSPQAPLEAGGTASNHGLHTHGPVSTSTTTDLVPTQLFIKSPNLSPVPMEFPESVPQPFGSLSEQDLFDHFVNVTADELVPIPYEENPFLSLLPQMALDDKIIWDLLVAYGASHKCMVMHGADPDPINEQRVHQLIDRCVKRLDTLRKSSDMRRHALLSATLLAMIEVDRGNTMGWRHFMKQGLEIIATCSTFSEWDLGSELNSMAFRLIGYMSAIGNMSNNGSHDLLSFPSWPEWTGSLDYLTGLDMNLLPLFSEAAQLIREIKQHETLASIKLRGSVHRRALRILHRMNDYWLDEYWPDSEITTMCIMFQQSLQIHVLRRVLQYPTNHPHVQRIITLAMTHLDRHIPPASTIQRCMTFSLATLASETPVAEHRTTLLIRLKHMALAGFAYNWKVCDDIRKHWDQNTSLITAAETTLIV